MAVVAIGTTVSPNDVAKARDDVACIAALDLIAVLNRPPHRSSRPVPNLLQLRHVDLDSVGAVQDNAPNYSRVAGDGFQIAADNEVLEIAKPARVGRGVAVPTIPVVLSLMRER